MKKRTPQPHYYTLESQILSTSQSQKEHLGEIFPSGRKKVDEGEAPGMRVAVSFVEDSKHSIANCTVEG